MLSALGEKNETRKTEKPLLLMLLFCFIFFGFFVVVVFWGGRGAGGDYASLSADEKHN